MILLHIQPSVGKLRPAIEAFTATNHMYAYSRDGCTNVVTYTWGDNKVIFCVINSREDYEQKIKGLKYSCLYIHKRCKIDTMLLQDIQFGMRK